MTITTRLSRRSFGLLAAGGAASLTLGAPAILRAQTAVTFAVPNPSALTWLPYWVAVGEGYFAEEGLDMRLEAIDGSSAVLQAMSAGQAQIGAPGPGPTLGARARGVDVKFLYNLYPKSVFGILVKDESPYQTPADLKGTVIGVGTADGAEVSFTKAIMTDLGMTEAPTLPSCQWVTVAPLPSASCATRLAPMPAPCRMRRSSPRAGSHCARSRPRLTLVSSATGSRCWKARWPQPRILHQSSAVLWFGERVLPATRRTRKRRWPIARLVTHRKASKIMRHRFMMASSIA